METFWAACKARGPLILEVEKVEEVEGSRPTRLAFDRPSLLIGSGPTADLRIDHPEVSGRHAYLQVIDGHLFYVDLDSRTGTHGEGGKADSGWLVPGHPIRIGMSRIRVRSGVAEEGDASVVGSDPLSSRDARSTFWPSTNLLTDDVGGSKSIPINRTLTLIGRSPRCKIRFASSRTSRFHGALLRTPGGVWVVDLRSTDGVSVNGVRLNYARLEDGDELKVGPLLACMNDPGMPRNPVPPALPGAGLATIRPATAEFPAEGFDLQPLLDQVAGIQQQSSDQFGQVILMLTRLFGTMHREMVELVREELEQIRRLSAEMQTLRAESTEARAGTSGEMRTRLVPHEVTPAQVSAGPAIPGEPVPGGPTRPRDPGEVHLIVGERLAAFERERQGRWNKLSRILLKTAD